MSAQPSTLDEHMFASDALADSRALAGLNDEQRAAAIMTAATCSSSPAPGRARRRRSARVSRRSSAGACRRADPAADVHPPCGARDARRARSALPVARRAPRRSAARSTRWGTGSCAGTRRRSASRRTSRCSTRVMPPTCSTSSARSRVTGRDRTALPAQATLADIYSRTVNAQRPVREVVGRGLPVVRGARRRPRSAVPGVHGAQASARRWSTSTTCSSSGER